MEITEILDPFLFDNHKDIINALFLVCYELSNEYVEKFYIKPRQEALQNPQDELDSDFFNLQEQSERKLRLKFNLSSKDQNQQREEENLTKRLLESKR